MEWPVRLICTDFDGTVHQEFEEPPVPYALQQFLQQCQQQGVSWLVNTGRDLGNLLGALDKACLLTQPDFLVVVEREIHRRAGSGYVPVSSWNQACQVEQERLFARIRPRLPQVFRWIQHRFEATLYADEYSPLCLIARHNADADAILDYLGRAFQDEPELAFVRNDIYARCSHAAINKGTAMAEVARQLGVGRDGVFVAGDHFNDLPMLCREYAQWIVAPANAIEEVKLAVTGQGGYVSPQSGGYGVMDGLKRSGWTPAAESPVLKK
jgi:hydroxymethylpyrimidine pyrophosphatase-like HAD family hydrolase